MTYAALTGCCFGLLGKKSKPLILTPKASDYHATTSPPVEAQAAHDPASTSSHTAIQAQAGSSVDAEVPVSKVLGNGQKMQSEVLFRKILREEGHPKSPRVKIVNEHIHFSP